MSGVLMLAAILLPILGSIPIFFFKWKKRNLMRIYLEVIVCMTSLLVGYLLLNGTGDPFTVVYFTGNLAIQLKIDGLSMVFAGLVSALWPFATLYSFEYMRNEPRERSFFLFYTMTYGVTLGIALAGNLLTMYFFYELLTLVTVPLVMQTLTREAILASRKYMYYSLGGAAFAFIGLIFVIIYGSSMDFVYGGVLELEKIGSRTNMLLLIYVFSFCGFGVKATLWPFNSWLPQAGVAPTPVTALLHAVAVVKSGAFAIIRLTYYSYGTEFLQGTWAQDVVMVLTIITIVYGCSRAVKETHLKRRLAYSTVSNLSYILFGVSLMTPAGLMGGLTHMLFHAFMKICSFFCVGTVIHKTGKNYVYEMDGLGKKMPLVFACFTGSALALMGVPGMAGFISKWYLASAAISGENLLAYIGVGALLFSALLTAIYMLTIVVRAYFPGKDFDYGTIENAKDPGPLMWVPLVFFVIVIIVFGLYSSTITGFLSEVAAGRY
ncbi:MAG: proton-conducting membrane transporter [Lachnospiraceae bacterium]|nr:proton-conducting membrane transporter [Lachnospiraceae bacterium]